MKSKEELSAYKTNIESEVGERCKILTANCDVEVANANNISEMTAPHGYSWVDYWRSMTGRYGTQLTCSSCGKLIFAGDIPKFMKNMFSIAGDTPDAHKACGGHILIQSGKKHIGERYITPLCPSCNNQRGNIIKLRQGTVICKELPVKQK